MQLTITFRFNTNAIRRKGVEREIEIGLGGYHYWWWKPWAFRSVESPELGPDHWPRMVAWKWLCFEWQTLDWSGFVLASEKAA